LKNDISRIYRNNVENFRGVQVQHITFNEFLPRVLGRDQLATFGLDLSPGYYEKYDPQCSVQTFNEFSSAAFR
jgi:peroxidase